MKITRTDKKLAKLGFVKNEESRYAVVYEREHKGAAYVQTVCILQKKHGPAIMQSYDKNLLDMKGVGNTCVGLTEEETRLFAKKMREYRRKPPKEEA
jgi:hypothetical protein